MWWLYNSYQGDMSPCSHVYLQLSCTDICQIWWYERDKWIFKNWNILHAKRNDRTFSNPHSPFLDKGTVGNMHRTTLSLIMLTFPETITYLVKYSRFDNKITRLHMSVTWNYLYAIRFVLFGSTWPNVLHVAGKWQRLIKDQILHSHTIVRLMLWDVYCKYFGERNIML